MLCPPFRMATRAAGVERTQATALPTMIRLCASLRLTPNLPTNIIPTKIA